MYAILTVSPKIDKKYKVVVYSGERKKTIHFGQHPYTDFISENKEKTRRYKDVDPEEIKKKYIERHQTNQDWTDPFTAGFWSRWILWNKPTLKESIKDTRNKFGIDIIYNE